MKRLSLPNLRHSYNPFRTGAYHVFEHELIVYGYKLAALYDKLKANGWEVLEESDGPYDPNGVGPFIQKIEYRLAL